jgi:arylsulfatase
MLLCQGSRHGGFALYLHEGHLAYSYNYLGIDRWRIVAPEVVPPGRHELRVEVLPFGVEPGPGKGKPAEVRLYVDDAPVAFGELDHTVPNLFGIVGMSCGHAAFDTVDPEAYVAPFPCTAELEVVRLDVSGDLIIDEAAELRRMMAQQ